MSNGAVGVVKLVMWRGRSAEYDGWVSSPELHIHGPWVISS
jgi:hypothetical protein